MSQAAAAARVVIPPRFDLVANLLCRLSDELAAMGGVAEVTTVRYVQDEALVVVAVVDAGAAQRVAEGLRLAGPVHHAVEGGWEQSWVGRHGLLTVEVVTPGESPLPVSPRVPLLVGSVLREVED